MDHWVMCVLDRPTTDRFRFAVINNVRFLTLARHRCALRTST
jgi:hypothetical protein